MVAVVGTETVLATTAVVPPSHYIECRMATVAFFSFGKRALQSTVVQSSFFVRRLLKRTVLFSHQPFSFTAIFQTGTTVVIHADVSHGVCVWRERRKRRMCFDSKGGGADWRMEKRNEKGGISLIGLLHQ